MSAEAIQLESGPDLYDLLQVSPRAHPDVIHAAYRELTRRYAPEVETNPHAARMARHVNAAYAVLRDDERRARYDAYRLRSVTPAAGNAPRPYRAAPALERVEWIPETPRPPKRALALCAAVILGMVGAVILTAEVFEDPVAPSSAGSNAVAGAHRRSLGDLIIDATRLTPGPCGPQFPGPMNPC